MSSGLTFATVELSGPTGLVVTVDGSITSIHATVPADLQGRLLRSGIAGTRVAGVTIGTQFVVVEILGTGGASDHWEFLLSGNYSLLGTHVGDIECPAGVLAGQVSVTGWYNGTGSIFGIFNIFIDGVSVPNSGPHFAYNLSNYHETFPEFTFRQSVAAGTHSVTVQSATTTSDTFDRLRMRVKWTPV